jgi:hypothetical protein
MLLHLDLSLHCLQVAVYALRWLGTLLCLEALTHVLYFNAVQRFGLPVWRQAAAVAAASGVPSSYPALTPLLAALTGW